MPKEVVTVDRFKLSCECEAAELGPIIAQLTKMGMTNLRFDVVTDVLNYRQRSGNGGVKAEEFLMSWMDEHPTFASIEAIAAFREAGRTDGAGYSAITKLVEKGVLKKLSLGNYTRSDVKAIAAPKGDKPRTDHHYASTHTDFILHTANRTGGKFTTVEMRGHFKKAKRPPLSMSPAVRVLRKKGLLKRVGEGEYELTAKGNGKVPETAGEPAHG